MKNYHFSEPRYSILFITQEFSDSFSGGAGVYARELVKAIVALGVEVHVMTMGSKNSVERITSNFYIHTHRVINLPLLRVPTHHIQVYKKSKKIVKKYNISSIHSNNNAGAFSYKKVPLLSTIHHLASDEIKYASFFQRLIYYPDVFFEKLTKKRSSTIITVSRLVEKQLKSLYPLKNIILVPDGVDLSLFKKLSAGQLRKEMKISLTEILLFFPGGARARRKGALDLIMAFSGMSDLNFKCIISGESRELGWKQELNHAIQAANFKDKFIWVGELKYTDLPKYYSCADIVVYPSTFEGFGLPALEALACGKPLICTKTGEMPYFVKNDQNGLLVSVGDVAQLQNALEKLIASTAQRKRLARNARKSIVNYSWGSMSERIIMLHKHILRGNL